MTTFTSLRSLGASYMRSAGRVAAAGLMLAAVLLLATVPEARAQVSGVSYTLSPVGKYVFFEHDGILGTENNTGLDNGFLYGGELGFGFGQYLEVSAIYLQGDNFETTFGGDLEGLPDVNREVDLQQYGARTRLNLGNYGGNGGFAPFISGGAGILRFSPEGVDESESIYLTGGVGLTLSALNRYTLTVEGQGMAYRYNPATTFFTPGEISGQPPGQQEVLSPALRASLQLYLGGRDPDEITDLDRAFQRQFSDGLGGVRLFVEPFYGRIEFASELKGGESGFYRDQNVAGLNAGIELGPYVGLRGFYWRGASGQEDVFDEFAEEFQPIAFYGGELNLRFGTSIGQRSFTPYGIIGGGYANALSDYSDEIEPPGAGQPADRYFGTLGGGVEVPLSNALKLQGDVRSLFMSSQDVADLSSPDEVYANLMYTAGLEFSIGGGDAPSAEELLEARAEERDQRLREQTRVERRADLDESEQVLLEEIQRLQTRIDSLERIEQRQQLQQGGLDEQEGEEAQRQAQMEEMQRLRDQRRQEAADRREERRYQEGRYQEEPYQGRRYQERRFQEGRSQQQRRGPRGDRLPADMSGRTLTLPVLESGEVYVRFGETVGETTVEYAPPMMAPPYYGMPYGMPYGAQRQAPQQQQQGPPPAQAPQQQAPQQRLSEADIAEIVRETVRSEMRQADVEGRTLSEGDISELVRETVREELAGVEASRQQDAEVQRLEEQINRLQNQMESMGESQQRTPVEDVDVRGEADAPAEEEGATERAGLFGGGSTFFGRPLVATMPYTGLRAGNGPEQLVIGLRGDYRLGPDAGGVRLAPEVALGFGDGTSIMALANGALPFAGGYLGAINPYVGAGAGIVTEDGLSGLSLALNTFIGADYPLTSRGSVFAEVGTLDFGEYTRLLLGYRMSF